MVTNYNLPKIHRKEFQMMTPYPGSNTAAGVFVMADETARGNIAMLVYSTTVQYLYHHDEDGFTQVPSGALAGAFGAGACGTYHPWSITYTANGGSTTTVTVAAATHNLNGVVVGKTIEFISAGTASGERRTITKIKTVGGGAGTITLTFDKAVSTAILNTHTFRIASGSFFVMNAGTIAAGIFKRFDVATMAWQASLATTNLPASWATDGRLTTLVAEPGVMMTETATGGTSTTLTLSTAAWTDNQWANRFLLIIGGTGNGQVAKITSSTSTTLSFAALTTAPDATSVFQILSQRPHAVVVATAGAATTITNSAKSWTTNQWTNYQIKIVAGTGLGQTRIISSNTGTVITVPAWSVTPDTTSVYVIEPNEDYLYLLGNNAVTMYRYSISANTWTVMAPTTARAAAPSTAMGACPIIYTGDDTWADETDIQDGRYIYSFRGGAGALLDRFDTAGGTSGAGAWLAITYVGTETFTTGSAYKADGRYIYIRKDNTNRFFEYSLRGNYIEPFTTNMYTESTGVLGNKIWVHDYDGTGTVKWVYSLMNTGTALHRIMII